MNWLLSGLIVLLLSMVQHNLEFTSLGTVKRWVDLNDLNICIWTPSPNPHQSMVQGKMMLTTLKINSACISHMGMSAYENQITCFGSYCIIYVACVKMAITRNCISGDFTQYNTQDTNIIRCKSCGALSLKETLCLTSLGCCFRRHNLGTLYQITLT